MRGTRLSLSLSLAFAFALSLALAFSLAGCMLRSVSGSGNVIAQRRTVGGFTAVSLSGSGKLIIDRTGTETLTITADDNLLPYLTAEVKGGELHLGTRPGSSVDPTRQIEYRLTVASIDSISVSGSGEVIARGVDTRRLEIAGSGSSDFTVSGRAEEQEISLSGSGHYEGQALASRRASIDISGSGSAVVTVSDQLDVSVSGSGSVDYIGRPEVRQSVSGSGSVRGR